MVSITSGFLSLAGAMGFQGSTYIYTVRLLQLEQRSRTVSSSSTPPNLFLELHPDRVFAGFLEREITYGFRIGFREQHPLRQGKQHLQSVKDSPQVVDQYIAAEVLAGKLQVAPRNHVVHINPIGIIPKPHQPGRYRLIVDLSAPKEYSNNDGLPSDLCSVSYVRVDDAITLLRQLGPGALMAKLDLKSAYRMVPVHELDQHLLGITWNRSHIRGQGPPRAPSAFVQLL